MIPKHERVAVDVGNGFTIITAGSGKQTRSVSFRSTFIKVENEKIANYSDKSGHYIVGDEALKFGTPQRQSTDSAYYRSERFRVLLCFGLKEIGVKNPAVIIGLPVENFDSIKKGLDEHIRHFESYKIGFTFNKIIFAKQPHGALCYPGYHNVGGEKISLISSNSSKLRVAVVDVGDGTTDCSGYYGGEPIDHEHLGRNFGVSEIHEAVLRHLREKYILPAEISTHDIDYHLRNNKNMSVKTTSGKHIEVCLTDLKEYKAALNILLGKIRDGVSTIWDSFLKIDYIVIAGGFVNIIDSNQIGSIFDATREKILTPDDPSKSISEGLLVLLNNYLNATELKKVKQAEA